MLKGYRRVSVIRGGLNAWVAAGYPVEKGGPAKAAESTRLECGA